MRCPYCRHSDSRVVDSREAEGGQLIRRRRSCPECGKRFTTVEEAVLAVVKRSGVTEPFSRAKIAGGVRKACQGRPVDEDAIALLAQRVEETVRARGASWTRWRTCGSPASTRRSTPSRSSSVRSPRCARRRPAAVRLNFALFCFGSDHHHAAGRRARSRGGSTLAGDGTTAGKGRA